MIVRVPNTNDVEIYPVGETVPSFRGVYSPDGLSTLREVPTVQSGWQEYANLVVPPDAGDVQYREMRKTWFAGVYWFMTTMAASAQWDEADYKAFLARIKEEIFEFNLEELTKG